MFVFDFFTLKIIRLLYMQAFLVKILDLSANINELQGKIGLKLVAQITNKMTHKLKVLM